MTVCQFYELYGEVGAMYDQTTFKLQMCERLRTIPSCKFVIHDLALVDVLQNVLTIYANISCSPPHAKIQSHP